MYLLIFLMNYFLSASVYGSAPQYIAGNFLTLCVASKTSINCVGDNKYGQMIESNKFFDIQSIAVGRSHVCILEGVDVFCFGQNDLGQSAVPIDLHSTVMISAGDNHTCVIDSFKVKCWGDNQYGQLDIPKNIYMPKKIVTGSNHTCVLDIEGVKCWGRDNDGQSSINITSLGKDIKDLYAGGDSTCIDIAGMLKCWGNKTYQHLPQDVMNAKDLSLGLARSCAIVDDNIKCWGMDLFYDEIKKIKKPKIILNYSQGVCVIDANDVILCEGYYLGNDKSNLYYPFTKISGKPIKIFASVTHTCLQTDQEFRCWGSSLFKKIKVPVAISTETDVLLSSDSTCLFEKNNFSCFSDQEDRHSFAAAFNEFWKQKNLSYVKIGYGHFCYFENRLLNCFLYNQFSQKLVKVSIDYEFNDPKLIAFGITDDKNTFCALDHYEVICFNEKGTRQNVPKLIEPTHLVGGNNYFCALDQQEVKCWGKYAQIVNKIPQRVINPREIQAFGNNVCLIDDEGVKCWGEDILLLNIPVLKNPRGLSVGHQYACVIDDLNPVCWGVNSYGQSNVPKTFDL